jgi:signal transduction histidine kinase
MPSRNFRPGWDKGSWQPPAGEWWSPGNSSANWQQFGRRVARRFIGGFALFLIGLVGFGAFIATAIVGTSSVNRWVVIVIAPLVAIAVVALIARYVRRTWRPVRELIGAAGALADGDYTVRVESEGSATIRPITRSFNDMAERLEMDDQARRRLLADLGHELRTPLTVVQGEIEAMIDGVHQPDGEHLELLLEEVAVMERLLEDLRTLTLAESGALALHLEPADLPDLIDDVLDGQRRSASAVGVTLTTKLPDDITEVIIDPVRVREVLANLVVNAIRAMPDGGSLELRLTAAPDTIHIAVADTGVGIDAEDLPHVFDRFRKGSTSSGSGLGLTISRDLVEAHGGSIDIESTPGSGTTVIVNLPRMVAPD